MRVVPPCSARATCVGRRWWTVRRVKCRERRSGSSGGSLQARHVRTLRKCEPDEQGATLQTVQGVRLDDAPRIGRIGALQRYSGCQSESWSSLGMGVVK